MRSFSHIVRHKFELPESIFIRIVIGLLLPLSWLYSFLISLRSKLYEMNIFKSRTANIPVIGIGNITAGGTGKTPFAIYLARHLISLGKNPAIVSRGYKSSGKAGNDEEKLVKNHIPEIVYCSNPDRFTAVNKAAESGADVAILDDGFQHLRLRRDLNIVTLDSNCPFSNNHVIPAGFLREPAVGLNRADIIVLTKVNNPDSSEISRIKDILANICPDIPVICSNHKTSGIKSISGEIKQDIFEGEVIALSSIAKPSSFRNSLEFIGIPVISELCYSDHHIYTEKDIEKIVLYTKERNINTIISTEKDIVKLREYSKFFDRESLSVFYLEICFDIIENEKTLVNLIQKIIK